MPGSDFGYCWHFASDVAAQWDLITNKSTFILLKTIIWEYVKRGILYRKKASIQVPVPLPAKSIKEQQHNVIAVSV